VYFKNGVMDYAHGRGNILGTQVIMDGRYNQITGVEMVAHAVDGEVKVVDVTGSAETAFYPREEDGGLTGLNKTQSEKVQIYLEDRKIHHILFTTATSGTLYPIEQIDAAAAFLKGFFAADDERPQSVEDLFRHPERKHVAESDAAAAPPEENTKTELEQTTVKPKKLKR
jgi:hypothetical protein